MERTEAIKKIRQMSLSKETIEILEALAPELKESEDERVIRTLFFLCKDHDWFNGATKEECLTWLEKQKEQKSAEVDESTKRLNDNWMKQHFDDYEEQKPAEWSEEDEKMRKLLIAIFEVNHPNGFFKANEINTTDMRGVHTKEIVSWLKSLRERFNLQPNPAWSEEDVDMLNSCISSIEEAKENRYAYKETDGDTSYDHEIAWLKSLRPRWRPSEEQMEALLEAMQETRPGWLFNRQLVSLYDDLKKL